MPAESESTILHGLKIAAQTTDNTEMFFYTVQTALSAIEGKGPELENVLLEMQFLEQRTIWRRPPCVRPSNGT